MDRVCGPSIAGRRLNLWNTRGVTPFSLFLTCCVEPELRQKLFPVDLVIVVVSVWFCSSLWKLIGSCHCTRFLKWLVMAQPHLGLFALIVRSLAGPRQSQPSPSSPRGHAPSISSASSWNSCWSSFSPSGVDCSLSAFLFSFPIVSFFPNPLFSDIFFTYKVLSL